jgi:steroid 5-alpha reductase family enzyme
MLIFIGFSALLLLFFIIIAFIVGSIKKNNGLMDIFYGPAYFVVALASITGYYVISGSISPRQVINTVLVGLWATRLAVYLFIRNRGKPEDFRYKAMRERWKTNIVLKSFIRVYLFQSLVVFIVAFPVWFINISDNPSLGGFWNFSGITLLIGIIMWIIGFFFETVGDYSLYKFKQNPENKGKIMDKGLWKYTQHPNYFGEVIQWWGIYVIAFAVPFGFISVVGPIFITYMIIKVSGVRLLDYRYRSDDKYVEYKQKTSKFIPWFPKKQKG